MTTEREAVVRRAVVRWADDHRPRPFSRWVRSVVLVAIGAALGVGGATAAMALSPAADPEPSMTLAPQETDYPQLEYFDRMSVLPGFVSGGLAEEDESVVEIYWHGDLPPEAGQIIADADADGVSIRIVEVGRSTDEVWSACLELVEALDAEGIDVWGFGPNRLNTTIELMGPELSTSPELQVQARRIAEETIGSGYLIAFLPNETGYNY